MGGKTRQETGSWALSQALVVSDNSWWRYFFKLSDLIAGSDQWCFQVCQGHSALWMPLKPFQLRALALISEKQPSCDKCLPYIITPWYHNKPCNCEKHTFSCDWKKCVFPGKLAYFPTISYVFLCTKRPNFPPNSKFFPQTPFPGKVSFPNSSFFSHHAFFNWKELPVPLGWCQNLIKASFRIEKCVSAISPNTTLWVGWAGWIISGRLA